MYVSPRPTLKTHGSYCGRDKPRATQAEIDAARDARVPGGGLSQS